MALTLNTNLSSLITQNSLKQSTVSLNQAVERMTTGYKINHSSDNAANYHISTNLTTKLNAYQIAEDNASMGLDLVQTASSVLESMGDLTTRLRALATQAQNGTYGTKSISAITEEANSIVSELNRLQTTAEYNGIKLFKTTSSSGSAATSSSKFISEITQRDTSSMTALSSVDETTALTEGTYSISTAEELAKLATMTNNGIIGANTEFVLANNIDLSAYSSGEGWTPIGNPNASTNAFKATFDGNGYTISNLYINRPSADYQGLFGYGDGAKLSNIALENVDVTGNYKVGGLVGNGKGATITNSYATGTVTGDICVGGLVGSGNGATLYNAYFTDTTGQTKGIESGMPFSGTAVETTISGLNELIEQGTLPAYVGDSMQNNITLQVGVSSNESSQIGLTLEGINLSALNYIDLEKESIFDTLDEILSTINAQQTNLGAAENRLTSALEQISINYENLVSSRSTIKDADVAELSSEYIRNQILQQASATLMATANQNPSIALQLL